MRVQQIVTICDIHAHESGRQDVFGTPYTFTINGGNTVAMDMCAECFEQHALPFLEALGTYGQEIPPMRKRRRQSKLEPEPEPDNRFSCPDCPRVFDKQHGLNMHRALKHKIAA